MTNHRQFPLAKKTPYEEQKRILSLPYLFYRNRAERGRFLIFVCENRFCYTATPATPLHLSPQFAPSVPCYTSPLVNRRTCQGDAGPHRLYATTFPSTTSIRQA